MIEAANVVRHLLFKALKEPLVHSGQVAFLIDLLTISQFSILIENCEIVSYLAPINQRQYDMTTIKQQIQQQKVVNYYEKASLDYQAWSKDFNMHFGYYKWGKSLFHLEPMLHHLNEEIFGRLQLDKIQLPMVLDAGCGLAASSRYMARKRPDAYFYGVTITPWQINFGEKLNEKEGFADQISLLNADFQEMPIAGEAFDAAFAIESACYADGSDKKRLLNEMGRVLRTGGRFVVADGFLKNTRPLPFGLRHIYQKNMDCWALKELANLEQFVQAMYDAGFINIKVEDVSWKIAPSFLHIPFVFLKFYWNRWIGNDKSPMNQERRNNANAPLWGMLMGLARPYFGYYIISGEKG